MRTTATVSKLLMWVFFVLSLFFHILAIIGLSMNNQHAAEGAAYDLRPIIAACAVMTLSVVLFTCLPKGKLIPLIAAGLMGVWFLVIAINLGNTFPASIGADGSDVGLTPWRLIYRHYSMLLTPICMAVAYFAGRAADKAEQERFNRSYRSQYDLSGGPLFHDSGEVSTEKKKRSVVARERKLAENARKALEQEERERAAAAIPLDESAE